MSATDLQSSEQAQDRDIISVAEAARRLGVCTETILRAIRAGQFPPAVRIGKRAYVSVRRLERYIHGDDAESVR
jgi:excisionase family DNA binding protein